MHIGSAPQGSDAYEGDAGADEYDGSARSGDLTVTNDGNSNDGEAGEGDNTWADRVQQRARRLHRGRSGRRSAARSSVVGSRQLRARSLARVP